MKNDRPLSEAVSLSISEAARYLRSSRNYVYGLLADGKLDWYYRGSRKRILRASLDANERELAELLRNQQASRCPLCNSFSPASDKRCRDRDHAER